MTTPIADVVAQAALMLTESLILALIDQGVLRRDDVSDAVEEVSTAWQVTQSEAAGAGGGTAAKRMLKDFNDVMIKALAKRHSH